MTYPKRLIEVDLPIFRISAHARREKSIRHGHISTLHIWWARRPLASCRAVICAALWPDPADPLCPQSFRNVAAQLINTFAKLADSNLELLSTSSEEAKARWAKLAKPNGAIDPSKEKHLVELRTALFDFIADFANWDNSTAPAYLETSRALTQAAHEAMGGVPGTRPLVVDPFAGGGSIPLEALRVGADAFASDLNPIPVLLNKVVLEFIPKYGQRLSDEVRKWGEWISHEAKKELAAFYPNDNGGAIPIAYLWARTIQCEGPNCGAEVPLMRSLWLAKRAKGAVALRLIARPSTKRVDFELVVREGRGWVTQGKTKNAIDNPIFDGTVKRGSATCPCCGYTTPVASVRRQLKGRHGGVHDARLYCVVTSQNAESGRAYRLPTPQDEEAVVKAGGELERILKVHTGRLSLLPKERFTGLEPRRIPVPQYGMECFADLFSPRQLLVLTTLVRLVNRADVAHKDAPDSDLTKAVKTCLALAVGRTANQFTTLSKWNMGRELVDGLFARQAIPMLWDFGEINPLAGKEGYWLGAITWITMVLERNHLSGTGQSTIASSLNHPLPDDSASAVMTDPPYYYSVPYSDLSDFFYVWLRRTLLSIYPELFGSELTPKGEECVQNLPHSEVSHLQKSRAFYENAMLRSLSEARRVTCPDGIGVVVFAHTDTEAWESLVGALIGAGWCVTGSWPIDTEMGNRVLAQRQSTLASSVHLVCRPRENPDGSVNSSLIGDWRDVLAELPGRIHDWMPRLAEEGVVGADAIFACLGPALEIFSRYSRVEKSSGEVVLLKEYLEQVWAAVSTEALSMIFHDADAAGLEPDARLTAMWLWTVGGGSQGNGEVTADDDGSDDDDEATGGEFLKSGIALGYDAARKIAQGLGVHLEKIDSVVEVKGDKARLRAVAERMSHLFGKGENAPTATRKKKKPAQKSLFAELDDVVATDAEWGEIKGPSLGETVLDRVHQSMILFAAGRSEAMKRFVVEDGAGKDARFWKLAQSLSALYPKDTDEKRWVDGVLARKKGFGL